MSKITAISDTHTYHDQITITPTDILLHAGDFTFRGQLAETISFLRWFEKQPAKHRIFCSGNHDALDQEQPGLFKELLKEYAPTSTYLRDEGITVEGIKIWGRPWTPTYGDWFFGADPGSPKMLSTLSIIPKDIDILLTHGPAYSVLDKEKYGVNVGCKDLLHELDRIQLKFLVCGHIHNMYGTILANGVTHINASILNDYYKVTNKPITFTIS